MAEKFSKIEVDQIKAALSNMVKVEKRAANASDYPAVKAAHEAMVKEFEALYIKVGQNL